MRASVLRRVPAMRERVIRTFLAGSAVALVACGAPSPETTRPSESVDVRVAHESPKVESAESQQANTSGPSHLRTPSSGTSPHDIAGASPDEAADTGPEDRLVPIEAGEYRYEQEVRRDGVSERTVGLLWVDDSTDRDGARTQTMKRIYVPGPDGWSRFLGIAWTDAGPVIRSESHPEARRDTPACHYADPLLLIRWPLVVGDAWSSSSRCDEEDESRGSVRRDAQVVDTQVVVVDERRVDAFVIDEELIRERPGTPTRVESSRLWYSAEHAMIVRSEITVSDDERGDLSMVSRLRSLVPTEPAF